MTRRKVEPVAAASPVDVLEEPSRYVDLTKALAQVGREREWLVEDAIEGSPIIVFSGPEKSGKSWANIDLAVSVASATPWMGMFNVRKPGTVFVVDGEYGPREWARRARRICSARGLDPADVFPSIRYFDGQFGFLLDHMNGDYLQLLRDVKSSPPALIIVDPFRNFLEGDENSAKDVLYAMRMLVGLRTAAECPVLATHHLNKGGAVSGSRAIRTRADLLIDGTDAAAPIYRAKGRSLRTFDRISNRFTIKIDHEDDHDDAIAKTRISLEWWSREHDAATDAADKVLVALKAAPEGLTVNGLREATGLKEDIIKRAAASLVAGGKVRRVEREIRKQRRTVFVFVPDWPAADDT